MTPRGPLTLAALASAAVPGLDPDTVEGVIPSPAGNTMEVAFVQDREHRRWVIRCPQTPAASAQLERSAALLAVLTRRLTMPVPAVKGWAALPEGGRAAVHSYLTGRLIDFDGVAPGSALAVGLGRTIAQLHNLDLRVFEEAGVPVYDAQSYRSRRLSELDRAAATGRVPTGLLTRWESVLDDPSLWTFTTTPTHGAIGTQTVLATPDDGEEPNVKALLGWESAQVADPADDVAPLLAELASDTFDTVLEAYAHARVQRPDAGLLKRARTIGEMGLVRSMMAAVAAGEDAAAEDWAAQLRRLDDRIAREEEAARAAAEEATAAQAAAATQPIGANATETDAATTDTAETDVADAGPADPDTAAADESEGSDEDIVQVEHAAAPTPAAPTPVTSDDPAPSEARGDRDEARSDDERLSAPEVTAEIPIRTKGAKPSSPRPRPESD